MSVTSPFNLFVYKSWQLLICVIYCCKACAIVCWCVRFHKHASTIGHAIQIPLISCQPHVSCVSADTGQYHFETIGTDCKQAMPRFTNVQCPLGISLNDKQKQRMHLVSWSLQLLLGETFWAVGEMMLVDDFVRHFWCHEWNDVCWWFCEKFLMLVR